MVLLPKRNIETQSLRRCTLFYWNPDVSENLELFDVNTIGERIGLVGHRARLPRRCLEQHWFVGKLLPISAQGRQRFSQSAGRHATAPRADQDAVGRSSDR